MAATPTKFSLGGMPRTRTGLVPTSYQRTADQLSEPKQWETLPTKPKPTLYPFRGDFVNAKNRKIARERKAARKEKLRLVNNARRSGGGDSLGSSLLVTPRSQEASSSQEIASDNAKRWDSYTKHISSHRLSEEQEHSRTQNKHKFSDWLRGEASKRQQRKGRGGKENKKKPQNEESVVRPRKPPVPRLSRLARGGGKMEKRRGDEDRPSGSKPNQPGRTDLVESAERTQTKVRYLDFITEKMEESKGCASEPAEPVRPDSTDDDDDESKFRSQIERIVQRAAEMVLTTEQPNEPDDASREKDESTYASPEDSSDASAAARERELVQSQSELAVLEKKLRQLSSSSVAASDAPSLSSSALMESREAGSLAMLDDTAATFHRDTDSLSEAMPRAQIQPMSVPAWREGTFDSSFDASNILRGLALSSSGLESSFQVSDSRDSCVDDNLTAASDANDTCTAMPREFAPNLSQQQSNAIRLEPCPEEAAMPPVQPSLVPQRVHWDEAPLPRGVGESYEASMTSDSYGARAYCEEEEPLPRGFHSLQPPKTGQALVDDLLEMLDEL